ncbi:MAG: choice-of-anchor B family protein [Bacteroidota bacterium]
MRLLLGMVASAILFTTALRGQIASNINLLGSWDDNTLANIGGIQYNDVWGYATGGREYALVGTRQYILFLEVTNPTSITEVARLGVTANVTWRDIKTYGSYAYSVSDGDTSDGLLVFDLTNINGPDPVNAGDPPRVQLVRQITSEFTKAHNVFIDVPSGILYTVGGDSDKNITVYDLKPDPANPALIGGYNVNGGYIHDLYVENHVAYASHTGTGKGHFIYDMSPVTNPPSGVAPGVPVELGRLSHTEYATYGLSHSNWKSGNYMVFADETHGTQMGIADVSDPTDIDVLDRFHSNLLNIANPFSNGSGGQPRGPIAHNPYILGNYVYVSYYHDGLVVFDISNPNNVTTVGYYDTFTGHSNYNGYRGMWGTYPYLPSGKILGSDTQNGLFVMELAILPVDWGIVRALAEKDDILVHWTTLQEENNLGFVVQRQDRSGRWVDLGQVVPEADQDYHFYDQDPLPGDNLYRIVQIDADGSQHYSKLVTARWQLATDSWTVFPSPARSGQRLTLRGRVGTTLSLRTTNGQLLAQLPVRGDHFTLPDLPAGAYVLQDEFGGVQRLLVR